MNRVLVPCVVLAMLYALAGAVGGAPDLRGTHTGDMNCDGRVDFDDINPFVMALIGVINYQAMYPACNWLNGDVNGDGTVDFDDINPFVTCLVNGRCS